MTPRHLASEMTFYHERAIAGRTDEAVRFAIDLLNQGTSADRIITGILAPSQRQIGDEWQRNEASVADEHVATGVTESALYAMSSALALGSVEGWVIVACAEGDWHSIAAHMFSEQLRSVGVDVMFLGASTPSMDVARLMQRQRPDALIVTCNLPIFFSGVVSLANVAHDLAVPVLIGGRAVADDQNRSLRLGADGTVADAVGVVDLLVSWRASPPTVRREHVVLDTRVAELELRSSLIADAGYARLSTTFSPFAHYDARQRSRTLQDLGFIVQFMAASQYVEDPSIFIEFLSWLDNVLHSRHVPRDALVLGLQALAPELRDADPDRGHLADLGIEFLTSLTDS